MNELARHIASLLLANDCVIIPDFGGFIAHYIPAQQANEDHIFLPPMRVIGFNPQLRINDGLLAQSYMSVYGSSFPDAVKKIRQQSDELTAVIHETGYMELDNVGELRYNMQGKYEFTPFDHRLATPAFYGLDSFKMLELKDLQAQQEVVTEAPAPLPLSTEEPAKKMAVKQAKVVDFSKYLRNVAAVAAIILLLVGSYFIASPFDKSGTYNKNEASVISTEMLKESLAVSSIVTHQPTTEQPVATTENQLSEDTKNVAEQPTASPASVKPSTEAAVGAPKLYHVIVASVGNAEAAQKEAQRLIQEGHPQAKAIIGDGKARVSVASFEVEADAYRAIRQFEANGQFNAAWVLRK